MLIWRSIYLFSNSQFCLYSRYWNFTHLHLDGCFPKRSRKGHLIMKLIQPENQRSASLCNRWRRKVSFQRMILRMTRVATKLAVAVVTVRSRSGRLVGGHVRSRSGRLVRGHHGRVVKVRLARVMTQKPWQFHGGEACRRCRERCGVRGGTVCVKKSVHRVEACRRCRERSGVR